MNKQRPSFASERALILLTGLICGVAAAAAAEESSAGRDIAVAAPGSDIYVVELRQEESGPVLGEPRNVTARPGYDNQPFFLPDGKRFYYTSIRDDAQADIYRHDLSDGESVRVTSTPESEYSPTVMPDGERISSVRVEADGTQRLWRFDGDGGNPAPVLPEVVGVGYHAWGNADTLGLFIVAEPPSLKLAWPADGRTRDIREDVGRGLQKVPNREWLAYVEKREKGPAWIRIIRLNNGLETPMTPVVEGSEDFVFAADGHLYMAGGKAIFVWERKPGEWKRLAEFDPLPGNITRLAVNPQSDTMAFVAAEESTPK